MCSLIVSDVTVILIRHCHFHPLNCCQRLPCCHFMSMSLQFSVLVGELLEDSSVASSVLQLPLLYAAYGGLDYV